MKRIWLAVALMLVSTSVFAAYVSPSDLVGTALTSATTMIMNNLMTLATRLLFAFLVLQFVIDGYHMLQSGQLEIERPVFKAIHLIIWASIRQEDADLWTNAIANPSGQDGKIGFKNWLQGAKNLVVKSVFEIMPLGVEKQQQRAEIPSIKNVNPQLVEESAIAVMRSAKAAGVQLDVDNVLDVLEGKQPKNGLYVGNILAVDVRKGLVMQSTGRGAGVVLPMSSLEHVPAVGELATIQMRDGRGTMPERGGKERGMGH